MNTTKHEVKRGSKNTRQMSGYILLLSKLYCTDGFLPWHQALGCWPEDLHPKSVPLVGNRLGQHRWNGQLSTQVVLMLNETEIMKV